MRNCIHLCMCWGLSGVGQGSLELDWSVFNILIRFYASADSNLTMLFFSLKEFNVKCLSFLSLYQQLLIKNVKYKLAISILYFALQVKANK